MLEDLDSEDCEQAFYNIDQFVNHSVLPQLRCLQSPRLRQLSNIVYPPSRLFGHNKRQSWPRRFTNADEDFVYCHIDLAQHNIFVDPKSFKVMAIID